MKKLFTALLLSLGLITSAPAQALDWDGFYMQGFGGANWILTREKHNVEIEFHTGYAVGGSIGYRICNGLRFEGEISYRRNTIKSVHIHGRKINDFSHHDVSDGGTKKHEKHSGNSSHGHLSQVAYMANMIVDFDITYWKSCCLCDITPYVGGGIGYSNQILKASIIRFKDIDRGGNGKSKGFAWQLIAGFTYEFSPYCDVSVEYRFFRGHAKDVFNHMAGFSANYHF